MSTARATSHTTPTVGPTAATDPSQLTTSTSPRNVATAEQPAGVAAVIARLPDVSAATRSDIGTASTSPADGSKQSQPPRLTNLLADVTTRWRERPRLPRNRRRAAIVFGSVTSGLGLIAVVLVIAPQLVGGLAGSESSAPPIAEGSLMSPDLAAPNLPPVGAPSDSVDVAVDDSAAPPLWVPPGDQAPTDVDTPTAAEASVVMFPSLPDPGSAEYDTLDHAASEQSATLQSSGPTNAGGAAIGGSTIVEPATVVSNQPRELTSRAEQSSGSEVFTWRKDNDASSSPRSYAPDGSSASTGPRSFRAPQPTPTTGPMDGPVTHLSQHSGARDAALLTGNDYRAGYQPAPVPSANIAPPEGLMPSQVAPMARRFPTTTMAWSNQRRQWATGDGHQTAVSPPANVATPYPGYVPNGETGPYAASPSGPTAPGAMAPSVGQQPYTHPLLR